MYSLQSIQYASVSCRKYHGKISVGCRLLPYYGIDNVKCYWRTSQPGSTWSCMSQWPLFAEERRKISRQNFCPIPKVFSDGRTMQHCSAPHSSQKAATSSEASSIPNREEDSTFLKIPGQGDNQGMEMSTSHFKFGRDVLMDLPLL